MKRLIATIGTALAGTTVGYVLHQTMAIRRAQSTDQEPQALIIGAPLATAGLAALVGLIFGKRSRLVALVVGFLTAATLGDKIDDMIPGWPGSKEQVLDRFSKSGPPAEAAGVAPITAAPAAAGDVSPEVSGDVSPEVSGDVSPEVSGGADEATSDQG
jgi:hypothetical protein